MQIQRTEYRVQGRLVYSLEILISGVVALLFLLVVPSTDGRETPRISVLAPATTDAPVSYGTDMTYCVCEEPVDGTGNSAPAPSAAPAPATLSSAEPMLRRVSTAAGAAVGVGAGAGASCSALSAGDALVEEEEAGFVGLSAAGGETVTAMASGVSWSMRIISWS